MNEQDRWSQIIATASQPSGTALSRRLAVQEALRAGAAITESGVGCSITQLTGAGFNTPESSSEVALSLDRAQYLAGDGPCVAACRDGQTHSIIVMDDEAQYGEFTAAARAVGVRSSLSLPLRDVSIPSALNIYAAATSAFEDAHVRGVAHLLTRCLSALLRDDETGVSVRPSDIPGLAAANEAHQVAARARRVLEVRYGLSPARAFHQLTQRSRAEQRGIQSVAQEILESSDGENP